MHPTSRVKVIVEDVDQAGLNLSFNSSFQEGSPRGNIIVTTQETHRILVSEERTQLNMTPKTTVTYRMSKSGWNKDVPSGWRNQSGNFSDGPPPNVQIISCKNLRKGDGTLNCVRIKNVPHSPASEDSAQNNTLMTPDNICGDISGPCSSGSIANNGQYPGSSCNTDSSAQKAGEEIPLGSSSDLTRNGGRQTDRECRSGICKSSSVSTMTGSTSSDENSSTYPNGSCSSSGQENGNHSGDSNGVLDS